MKKDIVAVLNEIIEKGLKDHPLPVVKGDQITIKNSIININSDGYTVFNTHKPSKIYNAFSKSGAIALATVLNTNKTSRIPEILNLDKDLEKHYLDSLFYKHTIDTAIDSFTKETREIRLEIALQSAKNAKRSLDRFISI